MFPSQNCASLCHCKVLGKMLTKLCHARLNLVISAFASVVLILFRTGMQNLEIGVYRSQDDIVWVNWIFKNRTVSKCGMDIRKLTCSEIEALQSWWVEMWYREDFCKESRSDQRRSRSTRRNTSWAKNSSFSQWSCPQRNPSILASSLARKQYCFRNGELYLYQILHDHILLHELERTDKNESLFVGSVCIKNLY